MNYYVLKYILLSMMHFYVFVHENKSQKKWMKKQDEKDQVWHVEAKYELHFESTSNTYSLTKDHR